MTELRIRLGGIIKQLRQERALTQDELAKKSSLHRTYVSDVERGERNLSLSSLHCFSIALNVSLSEIFRLVDAANAAPLEAQSKTPEAIPGL